MEPFRATSSSRIQRRFPGHAAMLAHASWAGLSLWLFIALVVFGVTGRGVSSFAPYGVLFDRATLIWAALCPSLALFFGLWKPTVRGTIVVEGESLRWEHEGKTLGSVPLSSVASARVARDEQGAACVEVELANGNRVVASVADDAAAGALVNACGMGPKQHRYSSLLGNRAKAPALGVIAGFSPLCLVGMPPFHGLLVPGMLANALFPVAGVLVGVLVALWVKPWTATVGIDGVRLSKPFAASRFISYKEISRVHATGKVVYLRYRDGRDEALPAAVDFRSAQALAARIEASMSASGDGYDASDALAQLERNGRTLADWRASLGAMLTGVGNFRSASLTRDELVAVLRDGDAPLLRRLGAALALLDGNDPEARELVRVAADASASEQVRVALGKALDAQLDERSVRSIEREAAKELNRGEIWRRKRTFCRRDPGEMAAPTAARR